MSTIYSIIESNYSLVRDTYGYVKGLFEGIEVAEQTAEQTIWLESILLETDISHLIGIWTEETKSTVKDYCEKRLQETSNEHLKAKYGWDLWSLTCEKDCRLLNNTVDYTFNCLSAFLDIDDFEHTDKFCHYLHKIYLHRGQIGKTRMQKLEGLFGKALYSDNENLRFQILANIYYQETDKGKKKESLLPLTSAQFLAEIALSLIKEEEDEIILQRKLEFAVFFADKTTDTDIRRKANEQLGDYKMSHLYLDDEKNLMIAHMNDHLLEEAMVCYKKAGAKAKLEQATLAYQNNQPKLRYLPITSTISVERRNQEIDLINKNIEEVVSGGTRAILDTLFGNGIDVFVSADFLRSQCNERRDGFEYEKIFGSVNKDSFQNSRRTTHAKAMLHMLADNTYRNWTFLMFELIICNGMKIESLTYDILKEELLNKGFDLSWNKVNADGSEIGTSYLERVELGLRDFLGMLFKSVNGEDVDWRYCTTFLSTQFEGLFRDALKKLGAPITRVKNEGDTELIPLEGLLYSEKAQEVFNANDLMLFSQTFTKDGYNIRNNIAHGLFLPQEFTAQKALLVFLCVIRLTKATAIIKMMDAERV